MRVSIIEPSSSDPQTLLAAGISPPCYEGICLNDLVRIVSASDDYSGRQGQVTVVQPDGCVVMQLYPQGLQSTPNDGIQPKEVDDEATFDPSMITVVLRVSQHNFFQFSPPDKTTGHKHDGGEVRRVLDNGYMEMKLAHGVSVAPLLLLLLDLFLLQLSGIVQDPTEQTLTHQYWLPQAPASCHRQTCLSVS